MGWQRRSRARGTTLFLALTLICAATAASGGDLKRDDLKQDDLKPVGVGSREVWVGVDAGEHNWLVYSGATYAPFGDIHADGLRLRATTGYGNYDYRFDKDTAVKVEKTYADALIGYQVRFGELTAKAFIGWALLNEAGTTSKGFRATRLSDGIKGAVELWLNVGPNAWTSLDLNYADTRDVWSVRSRAGYRVLPTVSVGIEGIFNHASLNGQIQINKDAPELLGNSRAGAFARYEWFGGEISASAGLSGDMLQSRTDSSKIDLLHRPSAYGTLNFIVQF